MFGEPSYDHIYRPYVGSWMYKRRADYTEEEVISWRHWVFKELKNCENDRVYYFETHPDEKQYL